MQQQVIPQGPTKVAEMVAIDRTMIFDPVELWSDPLACPDWPHLPGTMRYDGPRGRHAAEARLERVGQILNRGPGNLKAPTKVEREEVIARFFKRSGGKWHTLGLRDLSPAGVISQDEADMIVEAAHLRGYLRKLDAQAVRETEAREEQRLREARRTLANYRETAPAEIEEIKTLAEAVARHQQRLDDEKAFARSQMLRQHVETLHGAAVMAAHALSLSVPDAPDFL